MKIQNQLVQEKQLDFSEKKNKSIKNLTKL